MTNKLKTALVAGLVSAFALTAQAQEAPQTQQDPNAGAQNLETLKGWFKSGVKKVGELKDTAVTAANSATTPQAAASAPAAAASEPSTLDKVTGAATGALRNGSLTAAAGKLKKGDKLGAAATAVEGATAGNKADKKASAKKEEGGVTVQDGLKVLKLLGK